MNKKLQFVLLLAGIFFSVTASADVESKAGVEFGTFSDGLVTIGKMMKTRNNNFRYKCGYMNKAGHFPMGRSFEMCAPFYNGLAAASLDQKLYGYINHTGKFVIKPAYVGAKDFNNGLAAVILSGDEYGSGKNAPVYGLINTAGHLLVQLEPGIKIVSDFQNGVVAIKRNDKYGFLSIDNDKIKVSIPPQFQYIDPDDPFINDLAAAELNDKWGFISRSGEWKFPPQLQGAGNFHEGLACAEVNGKYGYIDVYGKWVISPRYENCTDFHDGLATGVSLNGQQGVIGKSGNWILKPQFNLIKDFDASGHALFIANDSMGNGPYLLGFIDQTGNLLFEKRYENWDSPSDDGVTLVKYNGQYGFINSNGEWVIDPDKLQRSVTRFFKQ